MITFNNENELALALRRAEAAHKRAEQEYPNMPQAWPEWYASYMGTEQTSGFGLPASVPADVPAELDPEDIVADNQQADELAIRDGLAADFV